MDALDNFQWEKLYSLDRVKTICGKLLKKQYSSQTAEMLSIVNNNGYKYVCEFGPGSGQTVIALAMSGVDVVAVDYQQGSLKLINAIADYFDCGIDKRITTVCCDVRGELPFTADQFDIIYHAGLLEHFCSSERIALLSSWKKYCKKMVSMVPNGGSLAYRYGKQKMINNGTWPYGTENIIYSQILEFIDAGMIVDAEYTIGLKNSMNFLEDSNYLKTAMSRLWNENLLEDDCRQGYLLVTKGSKSAR